MSDSQWKPIAQIAGDVRSGKVTASELIERALTTIDAKKDYNAIIATTADRARERAASIDEAVKNGQNPGKLAGVPFIAKDNFLAFGAETTAASNILKGFVAPYQATAIQKLEAEGAVCVAKANLDALAHGISTENSDLMTTKNPHDNERVPGGSSGGSAAAVVLEMAPFALGSDTGGSIRLPASFTGCVGYKPTYGLVSRSGVVAMASSTDTIGAFGRTVEDVALVMDVMAGRDPLDSTTIERDETGYANPQGDLKGKKFGLLKEHMGEGVDAEVRQAIEQVAQKLRAAGAEVQEISLPTLDLGLAVYYIICPAEVSSNLSRHDGQRYQFSAEDAADLDESYSKTRGIGFGSEAKRRIMIGTYVLSSGYYDAYYRKAQLVRTKLINEINDAFSKVDFLIGPVAPMTAFKVGEVDSPLKAYLMDLMTVAPSMAGIPGISVPAGSDTKGLPIGLHIMAPQRKDRELLDISKAVEELPQ